MYKLSKQCINTHHSLYDPVSVQRLRPRLNARQRHLTSGTVAPSHMEHRNQKS